jgi:N6-L-threonylcarbamoyladenine synthase
VSGRAIAAARGLKLLPLNHLEGHALTARLTDGVEFPYLLLLVSGGHTQLVAVEGVGRYRRLGSTIDDALGEAFDKTAKFLGLPFPGGPNVERAAACGDPHRFRLPRPLRGVAGCDFSLSGLKTALRLEAEAIAPLASATSTTSAPAFRRLWRTSSRTGRGGRLPPLPRRLDNTRPLWLWRAGWRQTAPFAPG